MCGHWQSPWLAVAVPCVPCSTGRDLRAPWPACAAMLVCYRPCVVTCGSWPYRVLSLTRVRYQLWVPWNSKHLYSFLGPCINSCGAINCGCRGIQSTCIASWVRTLTRVRYTLWVPWPLRRELCLLTYASRDLCAECVFALISVFCSVLRQD